MVLEARQNAEKIGYPVVGEEQKDASNVIDYEIREEQTIDSSSVLNANNNTTTGMATVIPGVNAPKLIASTSIIGDLSGTTEMSRAIISIHIQDFYQPSVRQITSGITIYNQGLADFTEENGAIIVGRKGIYNVRLQVGALYGNQYFNKTIWVENNGQTIISSTSALNGTDIQDAVVSLNKGDLLKVYTSNTTPSGVALNGDISISFM